MRFGIRAMAASMAAAALLLAGCTDAGGGVVPTGDGPVTAPPDTAAATTPVVAPTATSSEIQAYVTEPPTSAAEAISFATRGLENYFVVGGIIFRHPEDTTGLELVAVGSALENELQQAQELANAGAFLEANIQFELDADDSFVEPLIEVSTGREVNEFGYVTLVGCQDLTDYVLVNPDGGPRVTPDMPRYRIEATVIQSANGSWLVAAIRDTASSPEPC